MPRKQLKLTDFFSEEKESQNSGSGDLLLSKRGFTLPVQSRVLALVEDAGESGINITTLSRILNIKKQNIFNALNKLMKKGLVDRKNHFYFLTEDGKKQQELDNKRKKEGVNPPHVRYEDAVYNLPDFFEIDVHFLRYHFEFSGGVEKEFFGADRKWFLKNGVRVYMFKGWDRENVSVHVYPNKLRVDVHKPQGFSLEEKMRFADDVALRVADSFAKRFKLVLGKWNRLEPHAVFKNKEFKKLWLKALKLNARDKVVVGDTIWGSDRTHPEQIEVKGEGTLEMLENFLWFAKYGKSGMLELAKMFNELVAMQKLHMQETIMLSRHLLDVILAVQNLQNDVEWIKRKIEELK